MILKIKQLIMDSVCIGNKKEWKTLFLTVIGSMVVYSLLNPDLIISPSRSFLDCDQRLDYIATFSLINQFFHFNIPLWAPYDQMSLSYYYIVLGRDNFFNLITAIFCTPFLGFCDHPGEFFLFFFSRFYYLLMLVVRTIGSYLLLKKFCNKKIILVPSVIYLSCFLSIQVMAKGDSSQNLYPLIMYLVLLIIDLLKIMDLMVALLLISIQLGSSFLHFGFMWQALHFFILSALGYHFFLNKVRPLDRPFQLKSGSNEVCYCWVIGLSCFLIVLPNFLLWLTTFKDLSFQDSETRINHIFDVPFYLKSTLYFAQGTFSQLINPTNITTWAFIGYATVLMAVYGLLMAADKRKFIFFLSIVGAFSVTASSRSYFGIVGHVLNFFTNPFHFIVHDISPQIAMIIPYFIFPLTILGISLIFEHGQGPSGPNASLKRKIFVTTAVLLIVWGILSTTGTARIYITIQALLTFVFIAFMYARPLRKRMWIVMVFMFALDVPFLLGHEPNLLTSSSGHWNENDPSLGIKNYDIQNPRIMPFRLFFAEYPFSLRADILFNPCNMPGTFLRFTNMTKNFILPSEEMPRQKSFDIHQMDPTMQKYLMFDPIFVFEADDAVKASDKTFKEITGNNEERHIVMIEDERHHLSLPDYDGHSTGRNASPQEIFNYQETILKPSEGVLTTENGLVYLSIKLPKDWPSSLASTFLTQDQALTQLFIVNASGKTQELHPSMGKPIEPYSFDIKNYYDGLTVALPTESFYNLKNFMLLRLFKSNLDVWKYSSDQTGFDYQANADGWLVIHYPYDKRWRITVNGKVVRYYRANKIFMGFPISKGKNRVLIEYMPGSLLRPLIAISMVLIVVGIIFVFIYAIRSSFKENFHTR